MGEKTTIRIVTTVAPKNTIASSTIPKEGRKKKN